MIRIWVFIMLLLFPGLLSAQKIFWSDITPDDMKQAGEAGRSFLRYLENQNPDSIQNMLAAHQVYAGKGQWLNPGDLTAMLMEEAMSIQEQRVQLTAYRFDDFLEQFQQNNMLQGVYPAFDNHSVLLSARNTASRNGDQVIMVLRKEENQWKITALDGFGLKPEVRQEPQSLQGFRMERITEAGIEIPIPKDFSEPERSDGQVIFNLRDKTERDAVFQVLIDDLKAKVHYYTYKFVEFSNQQYDLSNLVVRYLPNGILFEYIVTDPAGIRNKGITMGMQNQGKMIVVQFYAFQEVYDRRKEQIMRVFHHIER